MPSIRREGEGNEGRLGRLLYSIAGAGGGESLRRLRDEIRERRPLTRIASPGKRQSGLIFGAATEDT